MLTFLPETTLTDAGQTRIPQMGDSRRHPELYLSYSESGIPHIEADFRAAKPPGWP